MIAPCGIHCFLTSQHCSCFMRLRDLSLNSVTQVPVPLKWEDQLVKESLEYNLTEATVRLFEERPIWAKLTLLDRLADFGVVITDAYVKRSAFLRMPPSTCGCSL